VGGRDLRSKKMEDTTPVGTTKTIGGGSRIPMNMNMNPTTSNRKGNQVVAVAPTLPSPDGSYREFTDHLMCQSTLNSSAMSTVLSGRKPLAVVATMEEEDGLLSPVMAMDQD